MTDNVTVTPAPVPLGVTPTVPLVDLAAAMLAQIRRERDLFLALVDERERLLDIEPRTAQIRKWWRERQR